MRAYVWTVVCPKKSIYNLYNLYNLLKASGQSLKESSTKVCIEIVHPTSPPEEEDKKIYRKEV